jgi:hypothetical protein
MTSQRRLLQTLVTIPCNGNRGIHDLITGALSSLEAIGSVKGACMLQSRVLGMRDDCFYQKHLDENLDFVLDDFVELVLREAIYLALKARRDDLPVDYVEFRLNQVLQLAGF